MLEGWRCECADGLPSSHGDLNVGEATGVVAKKGKLFLHHPSSFSLDCTTNGKWLDIEGVKEAFQAATTTKHVDVAL